MGPEALRVAGLGEALRARGLDVIDRGDLPARPIPGCRRSMAIATSTKWSPGIAQ
jgi:hypothetical protein